METKAGIGEHRIYRIVPQSIDKKPLTQDLHYIGVDAVAWYINKGDSWFTNRMASGTLEITLLNGVEKYQTALGIFELKGGSKTAPVFDRPVLFARNYRGGNIGFNASLTAIKKDTLLASVLKNAANASLGIVAGMVDTASVTGPTQLLTAAGGQLIEGVNNILSDKSDKHEPLFDFNGLEINLSADKIIGPETYLLFHRGASLVEEKLAIRTEGEITLPTYDSNDLEDGAWLLLRVKRMTEYPDIRPWFDARKNLKSDIRFMVNDVVNGFVNKEEALKQFVFSSSGNATLLDQFDSLRTLIRNDGVITVTQAVAFVSDLTNIVVAAKKSIEQVNKEILDSSDRAMNDMLKGIRVDDDLITIVKEQIPAVLETRKPYLGDDVEQTMTINNLINIASEMPITMKEFDEV